MHLASLGFVLAWCSCAFALDIRLDDPHAASRTAHGSLLWYSGNETGQIPGSFPQKWWEGSVLFTSLIHYWFYTGDDQYNALVTQALQWQAGSGDYLPANYSHWLGNDDQFFWGAAAMTAAEVGFPEDPDGFSWLSLAQGVFNSQTRAWDYSECGGGLRWQLWPYQDGWPMKNAISNGGFFQLAARLTRYTNNNTYADWAQRAWDWSVFSPLLDNTTWNVADSTVTTDKCTTQGNTQWSYNYGTYLIGAAYMYNHTQKATWREAVDGLLGKIFDQFFPEQHGGNIFSEFLCEPVELCNFNERLFKGIVSVWLTSVALVVPDTYDLIFPKLQASAVAAARSCSGAGNNTCGIKWYEQEWDGSIGMEQQTIATNILSSALLSEKRNPPLTSKTGGNSTSNPNAGDKSRWQIDELRAITTGDRVGAGLLTVLFVGLWGGIAAWMARGGPDVTAQHR
ncbi:glycoside hydrolase [Aspergillus crustosus]